MSIKSLAILCVLAFAVSSGPPASADINTHLEPDFYGAYTYEHGVPVAVAEGDVIGQGVMIEPEVNENLEYQPPVICKTPTPIIVGYRTSVGSEPYSVKWEFDSICRAVVTQIESGSQPTNGSDGGMVVDLTVPVGTALTAVTSPPPEETKHQMYAGMDVIDGRGRPQTTIWVNQEYSRWLAADGTRDISFSSPPTGDCQDGPIGFWTLSCERNTPAPEMAAKSDGTIDKRLLSYVVGEYGWPAFLISYKMTAYVYDWAGEEEGSGDCELDGTAPPGWGFICHPPIVRQVVGTP